MVIKAFPPSSCKKQINKQNSHLLLAFLQSGSVPELDMHESKHFLPGPFVQCTNTIQCNSLPNKVWGTYCFCSVSYYYFYFYYYYSYSFFLRSMNLSMADLRNYRTEFHETWWSYRYMFLVDPKVFRFVVKGVKAIFLGVQRGWGLL